MPVLLISVTNLTLSMLLALWSSITLILVEDSTSLIITYGNSDSGFDQGAFELNSCVSDRNDKYKCYEDFDIGRFNISHINCEEGKIKKLSKEEISKI